jgi:hypothetical protein
MAQQHIPDERIISAKFEGKCTDCGCKFPQGTLIKFNTHKRTARHVKCPKPDYARSAIEHEKLFEMWVRLGQETARVGEGVNE